MNSTSNIEHRTLNTEPSARRPSASGVRRSMFDVLRFAAFVLVCAAASTRAAETNDITTATNAAAVKAEPKPATRPISESDLLELLTATLQNDYVKDKGELELRLTRPWTPRTVPDEPITVKVLDIPANGVTPSFILRFEL
ncbi:MAG TPA: hypothetical protein VK327_01015, partial [Candidatus Paceibacterota bacterium]|nr:hypothetical protein [Candidatus Paceibacterota bacterium]